MQETFKFILIILILSIVSLILLVLFSGALRRIFNSRKYKKLDKLRELYRNKLMTLIHSGEIFHKINDFIPSPNSIEFQALEDVLFEFMKTAQYRTPAKELFQALGYIKYYEGKLSCRNVITKATAIDKLGTMISEASEDKLIMMLKIKNAEINSTSIRSLGRIGTKKALIGILEHLPELYQNNLIGHKTVEASLRSFGISAQPILVEYGMKFTDVRILSSILEVLSNMPSTETSASFALHALNNPDIEVQAKALKLIGRSDPSFLRIDFNLLLQYLLDSVWFIRLQAAKVFGKFRFQGAIDILGNLLLDPNWQVRNAATNALIQFDDYSLNIFLKALNARDEYAKQSICEEIQKSDFVNVLIENLSQDDKDKYEKSRAILNTMHMLNFSTPLIEYMHTGKNEKVKTELRHIMLQEKDKKQ